MKMNCDLLNMQLQTIFKR